MFKVDNRNTRLRCETCSTLTIKIPVQVTLVYESGSDILFLVFIEKCT